MTDNGSAMIAAETVEGLARLGVIQERTLPDSPYQNGKQETFFSQVEARLIAMLEGAPDLSLSLLNEATLAWIELEYHHTPHTETDQTPLARFLAGPSLGRPCPTVAELEFAFTAAVSRLQRHSDGTLTLDSVRFEVPSRFRHLRRLALRYISWDLRQVWLIDEATGVALDRLLPLDRARNADGVRRPVAALPPPAAPPDAAAAAAPPGIAPLLRKLMADYAATGLPPAYIPVHEEEKE
jgi:putative transposase